MRRCRNRQPISVSARWRAGQSFISDRACRASRLGALFIDWALAVDGGMKFFAEKFGRTPTRTGLKERFPQLRVDKYLVVKPEIVGPNFKGFTKLYNEIFGIGK